MIADDFGNHHHCRLQEASGEFFAGGGPFLCDYVSNGRVDVLQTRPLDLSIDETLYELTAMIHRLKAKRVVIDSLSGFGLALAPRYREDFRESLYRMVALLTGMGVTVLMTAELEGG